MVFRNTCHDIWRINYSLGMSTQNAKVLKMIPVFVGFFFHTKPVFCWIFFWPYRQLYATYLKYIFTKRIGNLTQHLNGKFSENSMIKVTMGRIIAAFSALQINRDLDWFYSDSVSYSHSQIIRIIKILNCNETYGFVKHTRLPFFIFSFGTIYESITKYMIIYTPISTLSIRRRTCESLHTVHRWRTFWKK